jgi:hypothetical protein
MAAKTIANLRSAGLTPASTDRAAFPGNVVLDFTLDGAKMAVAAADTVDFFELPAFAGMIVTSAAVTVIRPGTATGTVGIQLGATIVTGLSGVTAWATDAAAGTKLIKLSTAANTIINTGTASQVRLVQSVAALGNGLIRVRVFGTILEAPSSQV